MIATDLACWPLVLSVAAGAQTLEDQRAFLGDWTRWLDRGEPFAVLRLFGSSEALVHPEGGARMAKQWMQDNGARMRQTVMGIASVVPASDHERMSRMDIEKAFGVPGGMFADLDAALLWLDGRVFRPRGLALDRAAAAAAASRLAAAPS
jgi:hypothetical protein